MQLEQDKDSVEHEEDPGAAATDPEAAAGVGGATAAGTGGPGGESASGSQTPSKERRVSRAGPQDSVSPGGPTTSGHVAQDGPHEPVR